MRIVGRPGIYILQTSVRCKAGKLGKLGIQRVSRYPETNTGGLMLGLVEGKVHVYTITLHMTHNIRPSSYTPIPLYSIPLLFALHSQPFLTAQATPLHPWCLALSHSRLPEAHYYFLQIKHLPLRFEIFSLFESSTTILCRIISNEIFG